MSDPMTIVVVGAGPGGYSAAIRAAQAGAKVHLIEKDILGGTCLNRGCIPSKTLLAGMEALQAARSGDSFGFRVPGEVFPDMVRMQARKEEVVRQLREGIAGVLKRRKIDYIRGHARLAGAGRVEVRTSDGPMLLQADRTIIATGSETARPPFFDFSHPSVLTSDEALMLDHVPESVLIVGGGPLGCEFASLFAGLGSSVTVVEVMPQILPQEETRTARQLQGAFRKRGIQVLAKTRVERVVDYGAGSTGVTVELTGGTQITARYLLVAIGRSPVTAGLDLDEAGVGVDERGYVEVDDHLATSSPGIYAIGDVAGGPLLAHVAYHDAMVAVRNCLGAKERRELHIVPRCVYTVPEIAAIGPTEDQARDEGFDPVVGTFRMGALGKALALGEAQGFIQIVADRASGAVLGASLMGPHVTEVVHELAVAIRAGLTCRELGEIVHAHPTIAEAAMEAAQEVHHESVHAAS